MHRSLRVLSITLITAGLVIFADVAMTLAWKEPLSTIYGSIKQDKAEKQLRALEDRFPSAEDLARVANITDITERARALANLFAPQAKTGQGIGRVVIPKIDLDIVLVQGTDTASLQKGPGHYTRSDNPATRKAGDGSAFPGQAKTIGIAGHRTTYLAPFRRLDELERGDDIIVEMPYATFTYEVEKTKIVTPDKISIVRNVGYERVVLTACNPLYSAAQRIAALGKLKRISFFGTGDRVWMDP